MQVTLKKNFCGTIFSAGLSNSQLLSTGKEKHVDITEKLSVSFDTQAAKSKEIMNVISSVKTQYYT